MNEIARIATELDDRELRASTPFELAKRAMDAMTKLIPGNYLDLSPSPLGEDATLIPLRNILYGVNAQSEWGVQASKLAYEYNFTRLQPSARALFGATWPRAEEVALYDVSIPLCIPAQSGTISGEQFASERREYHGNGLYVTGLRAPEIGVRLTDETCVKRQRIHLGSGLTEVTLGGPLVLHDLPEYLLMQGDKAYTTEETTVRLELPNEMTTFLFDGIRSSERVYVKGGSLVVVDPNIHKNAAELTYEQLDAAATELRAQARRAGSTTEYILHNDFGMRVLPWFTLQEDTSSMHQLVAQCLEWEESTDAFWKQTNPEMGDIIPPLDMDRVMRIAREAIQHAITMPQPLDMHIKRDSAGRVVPTVTGAHNVVKYLASYSDHK